MIRTIHGVCAALVIGAAAFAVQPASATTMKECSTMYKAAQKAGTLNGMKWNDFRKAKCGASAAAEPTGVKPSATATKPSMMSSHTPMQRASGGNAVFPKAISSKYTGEKAGTARMHTCRDQYNANGKKGSAANGGMSWIQKGGGYYSECNKHLKS